MNQSKLIQLISIAIIIASVLISGYILLKPKGQPTSQNQNTQGLAPMVDGKQLLKMTVNAVSYSPNFFKVKVGVPVKWEITSSGQPGCASGMVIANGLVNNPIYLNPQQGQVAVAEFTPQSSGTYRFSCSMNMVRGSIQVIN